MNNDDSKPVLDDTVTLKRADVLARIAALTSEHDGLLARAGEVAHAIEVEKALLRYFPASTFLAAERAPTIREMLKEVMAEARTPIGIRQMIDAMQERFGATVARTSISPILRKMLVRSEVEHIGDKWALAFREGTEA